MQGHTRLIRASFIGRKLRHIKMGDKTQIIASEQTSGSPTGRKYTSLKQIKFIYKIRTKFILKKCWPPSRTDSQITGTRDKEFPTRARLSTKNPGFLAGLTKNKHLKSRRQSCKNVHTPAVEMLLIKKMLKIKNSRLYKKNLQTPISSDIKSAQSIIISSPTKNGLFLSLNGSGFLLNLNVDKFTKVCIEKLGIHPSDVASELEGADFVSKFLSDITSQLPISLLTTQVNMGNYFTNSQSQTFTPAKHSMHK